jgi:hypothetical protein
VREEREPRSVPATRDPGDEVRALGRPRIELAAHAVVFQVLPEDLGRLRLVAGRIDRIDLDQPLEEIDDLAHFRVPSTSA